MTAVSGLTRIDRGQHDTVASKVARQLLDYILTSDMIKVGDRLPSERELATLFDVGRSAVREALKALNFLGLLEIRPGSGTFVQSPDSHLLPQVFEWGLVLGEQRTLHLVEARSTLEIGIAGLAAERHDHLALDDLQQYVDQMSQAEAGAFVEADMAFHLRLAESTGNPILAEILSSMQSLLRAWISRVVMSRGVEDLVHQHQRVLEGVRSGDRSTAEEAMRAHMTSAYDRLIGSLPNRDNQ